MGRRSRPIRRRRIGLIPWIAGRLAAGGGWCVRYPQPFILVLVICAAGTLFWHTARRGTAFRIASVQMTNGANLTLPSWVMGTNLWELDIRALADYLKSQRPDLRQVRVTRRPPDTLVIDTVQRVPVAQVQLGDWHQVDVEGFILLAGQPDGTDGLIRLLGVSVGSPRLRPGTVNQSERLALALRVVEAVRPHSAMPAHEIAAVDVTNPRDIRLVMTGGTEVRCGAVDELQQQLSRLDAALKALAARPMSVRYIDVRFDEPVIEPST